MLHFLNSIKEFTVNSFVNKVLASLSPRRDVPEQPTMEDFQNSQECGEAHILYNPFSLDSMAATMYLLSDPNMTGSKLLPYDRFTGLDTIHYKFKSIYCVGVELTQFDIGHVVQEKIPFLTTCYRDSYRYLDEKRLEKMRYEHRNMFFLRPNDEYIDHRASMLDNSAISVVHHYFGERDIPRHSPYAAMVELISSYNNFCPLLSDNERKSTSNEGYLAIQASLMALQVQLRAELNSLKPDPMKELTPNVNVETYMAHFQKVRMAIQRGLHMVSYGPRSKSMLVPTMSVSEMLFHDTCSNVLLTHDTFVGYEDTRTHRVWRIYDEKIYNREFIVKYLNPLFTWSEGSVLCAITNRPSLNV
jgi:hypothetical protein